MPSFTRTLHPALRGTVESCIGYDFQLPADAVHHGLPSTTVTVVLSFDEPIDCGWLPDGPTAHDDYWMLAAGLHTRPSLIRTHGHQHGLQLALTPLGARSLLGVPPGAVGDTIVHADDLAGGFTRELRERLAESDWATRFDLLEAHLLERLAAGGDAPEPEIAEAWRVLRARRGGVRVDDLARHVGWSRRHLATRFRDAIGVTPKQAARVARFEHAQRLLDAGAPASHVAVEAGYADQPHLHREWRALAGMTPRAFLDEFPFVQDGSG